jgi:tetratricopeptide (TPR) repeat protein
MTERTDAASWRRVKAMLAQVIEQPAPRRRSVVEAFVGKDVALRDELLSLLDAHESDESALEALPADLTLQAVRAQLGAGAAGQRVGPWRLISMIAHGGQGDVYRAERADGEFAQHVAVKLLRRGLEGNWSAARFATERQILASLDHPNLARLLDGGTTDDGLPYFVMELVEGEPIDRFCTRHALSLRDRLKLFRTVCQVVGYAHSKAIVHRDLKCDNILVTPGSVVKLVDFGIAKDLGTDALTTATAHRMMTPAYGSPEQVRGDPVTPASDVYSLGVVLYRLLTDTSPYAGTAGDAGYQLTRAICDTEPPAPSRAATTAPTTLTRAQRRRLRGDLDAVVMMALRKDPARRYADATAFGEDIFRHLENLPVRARRGAWSYRTQRFVVRHRVLVGAAMVANLALLAGLGGALYQGLEARRQQQRAESHLASVRDMANTVIFDVHKAIEKLPGSTGARKAIVEKALPYLERLGAESAHDPALQVEIASAYRRLADIQGRVGVANIGDSPGAIRSYERARDLLDPLVTAAHAKQRWFETAQAEFVGAYGGLGDRLSAAGRQGEADATLRKLADTIEQWMQRAPADTRVAVRLADAYRQLSVVHSRVEGGSKAADAALERAESLLQAVVDRDSEDEAASSTLGLLLVQRAHLLSGLTDEASARPRRFDYLTRAQRNHERLLERHPGNREYASTLIKFMAMRAAVMADLAPMEQVTTLQRQALAIGEKLEKDDPADAEVRSALVAIRGGLGEILVKQGRYDEGIGLLQASAQSLRGAAKADAAAITDKINLGLAEYLIGRYEAERNEQPGAKPDPQRPWCRHFRASMAVFDELGEAGERHAHHPKQEMRQRLAACPAATDSRAHARE